MEKDMLEIIRDRKSSKGFFDETRPVTAEELNKILEAARWTPTAHNMQNFELIVVDDKKLMERIAAIPFPMTKAFLKEHTEQLSATEEEWRKKKTGALATNYPPALREVKDLDDETLQRLSKMWGSSIPTSSFLVFMLYDPSRRAPDSENDFLGVMSLGCLLQNVWLMATAQGIDFHVVSPLSSPRIDKEVRDILKVPPNLRVALAFRLGHVRSDSGKRDTVRRDIEDFTYYNSYGHRYTAR